MEGAMTGQKMTGLEFAKEQWREKTPAQRALIVICAAVSVLNLAAVASTLGLHGWLLVTEVAGVIAIYFELLRLTLGSARVQQWVRRKL
jgi:high-affinity K+ transport system ATPase subunit B